MRLIVQSLARGAFLIPGQFGPEWEVNLGLAGGGIVPDEDHASRLIYEHCDWDDKPVIINLDLVLIGT